MEGSCLNFKSPRNRVARAACCLRREYGNERTQTMLHLQHRTDIDSPDFSDRNKLFWRTGRACKKTQCKGIAIHLSTMDWTLLRLHTVPAATTRRLKAGILI